VPTFTNSIKTIFVLAAFVKAIAAGVALGLADGIAFEHFESTSPTPSTQALRIDALVLLMIRIWQ
jgi:hypothetical protein